ncbi:MAG: asparagine synthetase B family protein [Alphaproteobacteria bacterium]
MSAVAAIWRFDGRPVRDDVERMTAALRMYGPDGSGSWFEGGVGLGHCAMVLLPEDRADRQPRAGGDGALMLSASARLDNRDELGAALGLEAARLKDMADSDLVLHVLEKWGEAGIPRLVGAFAFALWDGKRRRLICARDALGERGLVYHRSAGLLAVASMPKGLHAVPEVPREVDERQIARGLLLLPGGGGTMFAGLETLRPGHMLVASERHVEVRSFWQPPPPNSLHPASEAEAVEAFSSLLDEAVRCRLRSVGGIGSHLSSGMDSGTVTAVAARLLAAEGRGLTAFTSVPREGYEGRGPFNRHGDEGPGARAVAAMHPNIDHRLVRMDDRTPMDGLDLGAQTCDRPPANPCNMIWINEICRQARQSGIRVMLTGQMGNMTISYSGRQYLPELLLTGRLLTWAAECWHLLRRRRGYRAAISASLFPIIPGWLWRLYDRNFRRLQDPFGYTAIAPAFAEEMDFRALAEEAAWNLDYQPWADGHAMRLAVLRRIDTAPHEAGMRAAFGVDHRDPTADRRLVEFCLALPNRFFLHRGIESRILKLAMRGQLPEAHLWSGGYKGYQAIDWHEALTRSRSELAQEIERLEASPLARRCLDLAKLRTLVDNWPTGDWHSPRITHSYRLALTRGIAMGRFIRRMEGGNQ